MIHISFYRVYRYPLKGEGECDRHIYFKRDRFIPERKKENQKVNELKLDTNLSRARRRVLELAYCNMFDMFCTFTIDGEKSDRYDLSSCKKKLSKIFNNYKYRYSPDFKYMVVPEFHKDGGIHFHGLVSGIRPCDLVVPSFIHKRNRSTGVLELVPNTLGYRDWPYYSKKMGYFNCSDIRNHEAVSRYIIKYITKDLQKLPKGQQAYICSKGLKRAELVFDCDALPMVGSPEWQDDFIAIQWHSRDYLYDQYGVIDAVCSDLHVEDKPDIEPTYEQLKFEQVRMELFGG